jgi:hypothetical protein
MSIMNVKLTNLFCHCHDIGQMGSLLLGLFLGSLLLWHQFREEVIVLVRYITRKYGDLKY